MIRIVTDSVASIPRAMARAAGIEVVTLFVNRDGVEHRDADMDLDAFYADIADMVEDIPTSSQPSQLELENLFEDAARAGDEVLGIFISSGLSGTYEGAVRAARTVQSRNIDFKYCLIDSTSCGFDEAWPAFAGAAARLAGATLRECADTVVASIRSTRFLFTPETLTFLQKGGRIGGAAALVGNLVKIAPVLTVRDGQAETLAKVRTRKKALERIVETFKEDVERCGLRNVVVHYIGDKAPAIEWAREKIEPIVGHAVQVVPVSPVIGLHVGPAVGIAYECVRPLQGKVSSQAKIGMCAS